MKLAVHGSGEDSGDGRDTVWAFITDPEQGGASACPR